MARIDGRMGGALVLLAMSCLPRAAKAQSAAGAPGCGDFGGLAVGYGGAVGLGFAGASALVFPALARRANPALSYWPGVGYALAGGVAGALGMTALNAQDCPESAFVTPALAAVTLSGISTLLWARLSRPKSQTVSLTARVPTAGRGLVIGIGKAF
jgi:hypothetical protein